MRLIDADNFINNFRLLLNRTSLGEISPHESVSVGEIAGLIKDEPTAFDLESVIAEMEELAEGLQSDANDLASIGDYGCATKFEGMAQAYKDCVNILKSAANATNGKNGEEERNPVGALLEVKQKTYPSKAVDVRKVNAEDFPLPKINKGSD